MRLLTLLVVASLVTASFAGVVAGASSAQQPPPLRLHRALIDTQTFYRSAALQGLAASAQGYRIVQFEGPITLVDRVTLEASGVTLLEYVPDFAYLVRGNMTQLSTASQIAGVIRVEPFTLADKLSPGLLRLLANGAIEVGRVHVVAWPDAASDLDRQLRANTFDFNASMTANDVIALASLSAVRWIESAGQPRLFNDVAREIMNVDDVWQQSSLFGAGQIVAVTDTGLDTGNPATLSPDFGGRIVATHVLSATGDWADQHGHGTHVAGSIAGAGVQSGAVTSTHSYNSSFAGMAPEASLVIQGFEADNATGAIFGLPSDYYPLFSEVYTDGARLHSNSWGDVTGPITDTEAAYGGYPFGSQRTDEFIWDHPDMTIFFAAGNSGVDGVPGALGFCTGGDGVVDPDSLAEPGTAKNVITVGAAESVRASGGLSAYLWFLLNFCFGVEPIAFDLVSNNANGMAAFSSRGPTDDGRLKPDIVAPGTNIISNQSHMPGATTLWGSYDSNYAFSGGTSMATPLTAGAGALVREWLTTQGIANPSAALVKATLLNTAADIAPGQYGTGATQEIPFTRPNSVDGWGRVDLGFITASAPYDLWVDDHTSGLSTGSILTYTDSLTRPLEVLDSAQPLRVMLVWTDPPASLAASTQLVNDLDLVVIGPGDVEYYGNANTSGDRLNNVEGVIINNPPVGQYIVQVRAFNVPIASQPYALAVAGPLDDQAVFALSKTAEPASVVDPGASITYTLSVGAQNGSIAGAVLSDTLPANTSFVSASDTYTLTGDVVEWSLGDLASDETVTRTLVVDVSGGAAPGSPISNNDYRASGSDATAAVGSPVIVTVAGAQGDFALNKTANPASTIDAGERITYTLSVSAQDGPISNALLTDTLPVSTTFISASDSYTLTNDLVEWWLGDLAPGQTVTRTLVVEVDSAAPGGGQIVNANYRVSSPGVTAVQGLPVAVTINEPPGQFVLNKTAEPASMVVPGQRITYTLSVGAQDGPIDDVVLSDTLPLSTTFISASGSHAFGGGVVQWTLGDLASGQTLTHTLIVEVVLDITDGVQVVNSDYRVSGTGVASMGGAPVAVGIAPLNRIYLPILLR